MIVKVQLSLIPSVKRTVLVYNRERTVECECPATPAIRMLMNGANKRFFEANLLADGRLAIENRLAPDQPW